jgi:hypothetical protein
MAMVDSVEVEQFEIAGSFVEYEEFPKQRTEETSRLCLLLFFRKLPVERWPLLSLLRRSFHFETVE